MRKDEKNLKAVKQSQIEKLTEQYCAGEITTKRFVQNILDSKEGDRQRRQLEQRIERKFCY